MIEDLFPYFVLISAVAMPLVLWLGHQKVNDLFHPQGKWSVAFGFVFALMVIEAIIELNLNLRIRFLGADLTSWVWILFLMFYWIRTLALVSGKVSASPTPSAPDHQANHHAKPPAS